MSEDDLLVALQVFCGGRGRRWFPVVMIGNRGGRVFEMTRRPAGICAVVAWHNASPRRPRLKGPLLCIPPVSRFDGCKTCLCDYLNA
jgi:hypothetical protein